MKRQILIFALFAAAATSSCQQQEIPLFGNERYIHFSADTTRKVILSFAVMPGQDETEIGIPITMIGRPQDQDLAYEVAVVTEGPTRTTLSADAYELPAEPVFRAGLYEDTLFVKLFRRAELDDNELKLTLTLRSNSNYTANFLLYSYKEIFVSDKLVQPEWWTQQFADTYLGPYSDEKYLAFIEATGESDLTGMNSLDLGSYVRMFVYWLREKDDKDETVYESDGTSKVLDSITYANV